MPCALNPLRTIYLISLNNVVGPRATPRASDPGSSPGSVFARYRITSLLNRLEQQTSIAQALKPDSSYNLLKIASSFDSS
jgi:hypothetical protein